MTTYVLVFPDVYNYRGKRLIKIDPVVSHMQKRTYLCAARKVKTDSCRSRCAPYGRIHPPWVGSQPEETELLIISWVAWARPMITFGMGRAPKTLISLPMLAVSWGARTLARPSMRSGSAAEKHCRRRMMIRLAGCCPFSS